MTPEDEEFARIEAEINRRQPVPVKTYHDGKPWPVAPKPWVGLTDEDIEQGYETTGHYQTLRPQDRFAVFALARAIEVKLKEKNQ